ncbi:hypothetical protein [Hymenobacter crusticola]|uniref:hypothetical protein n=1 Tax=Hymenobacter crusticola TaxID=1770526 RepID=UPI00117A7EAE|nr:hypothetical protein [Hymenobacter crusticola]
MAQQPYNTNVLVLDTDATGAFVQGLLVPREQLNPEYRPEEDSFHILPLSERYLAYFDAMRVDGDFTRHLEALRQKAVEFRLEPVEKRFGTTIGAADIGSFLQKVTRSFRSYVEVRFEHMFRSLYALEETLYKDLQKILEVTEPRSVFANHGSFEISLAVDIMPLMGQVNVDGRISDWYRVALQEYKQDVIDFDYTSGNRPANLEHATPEQMRAIYQPIISIANNADYVVQSREAVENGYRVLPRITQVNARSIAPPRARESEEQRADTEFLSLVLEVEKNKGLRNLSVRELRKSLVTMSSSEQTEAAVEGFTSAEGQEIQFGSPLEIVLAKTGSLYEARYEPLDIVTLGPNAVAALDGFKKELRNLYTRYLKQRDQEEDAPTPKLVRIMAAFKEALGVA